MRVIKRSGRIEDMKFDNVTNRIKNLTYGLSEKCDSSKVAQQVFSSMYDNITAQEIDTLSAEICVGMITSEPDYEVLATRIIASNIHKVCPNNFHLAMKKLQKAGVVTDEVVEVAQQVKDDIKSDRDFDFGYFGIKTLEKGYLQRVEGKLIETPQYMFMRVSIGIHGKDIPSVLDTYDKMSRGLFIHATPTLFNAGTPRPQMSSCFLIANKGDSIDGIYGTLTECAQISKWAGGIGMHIHDIRANKSRIRGTNGQSDGIIPMLRVFNATARYVNQAGRRKGSIAVYVEPWHADIMDFLELRLNQGDEEARCRDLFSAMWIPDLFMKRVEEGVIGHSSVQTRRRVSPIVMGRSLTNCTQNTKRRDSPIRLSQPLKYGKQFSSLKRRLGHHTCFTKMHVTRRVTRRIWASLRVPTCVQRL